MNVKNLIEEFLTEVAVLFSAEVKPGTLELYLKYLDAYSVEQLSFGLHKAVQEWDRPSALPTPAFIKLKIETRYEVVMEMQERTRTQEIIARPPIESTPQNVVSADLPAVKTRDITRDNVQRWLEGGKAAQRAHIAALAADPKWQALAVRFGAVVPTDEQLLKERNSKRSYVPSDDVEFEAKRWRQLKTYHDQEAREPGEEG